ncbi:hypothetical protein [Shewanella sp. UCD-KL21]|uniref:hypothetical protein n=1 Tax=Shewanella sp. UCD-KL21 TaxID=1917164 RepID=UPI00111595C8|nr:hypothetical protein [Shewanella sp. UCD-KL21]
MPVFALAIFICVQAPVIAQVTEKCDVRVNGNVPENIPLNNVYLRTYNKSTAIKKRQFSFCFNKQDLEVTGTFIPNRTVSLSNKIDGMPKGIYSASLFVQTKEVELNDITGMATRACNLRCNYYLYQKMLAKEEIAAAAKTYPKQREKLAADDWDAIVKLNSKQSDKLNKVYSEMASVQTIDVENNPIDSPGPYSGANFKFLQENSTKLTFFKKLRESQSEKHS